jgi:hypothetical protein
MTVEGYARRSGPPTGLADDSMLAVAELAGTEVGTVVEGLQDGYHRCVQVWTGVGDLGGGQDRSVSVCSALAGLALASFEVWGPSLEIRTLKPSN